jgi:hypothetical protein
MSKRRSGASRTAVHSGNAQHSQGIVKVSGQARVVPPLTAGAEAGLGGTWNSREQAMQGGTLTLLDYSRRSHRRRRSRRRLALALTLTPMAMIAGMAIVYWLQMGS